MIVLAVDTSHPVGSVALAVEGEVIARENFGQGQSHLQGLAQAVDRILHRASRKRWEIQRVALVVGPGSFTGLRIGMAFAKGLRAAVGSELVTLGTLELLALPYAGEDRLVVPMIDARRDEVYAAAYQGRDRATGLPRSVLEPETSSAADFVRKLPPGRCLFLGTGAVRYRSEIEGHREGEFLPGDNLPSAEHLALVAPRLEPLSPQEISALEPFYIRPSDAELKRLKEVEGE